MIYVTIQVMRCYGSDLNNVICCSNRHAVPGTSEGSYTAILCASRLFLLPLQPQPSLSIVLSSSFPGHKTSPRYTARIQKAAVTNHMITSKTVKALAIPFIASLCNTFAVCIVASVSPAFGKIKAHQLSENDILQSPARTAIVVTKKNQ